MKRIIAVLALAPTLAFAECPVLTGEYVCEIPTQTGIYKLPIKIVSDGNKYTFTNLEENLTQDWVATEEVKETVTPTSEGDLKVIERVWCEDGKLRASFDQFFYHEGTYSPEKIATMEKFLEQEFFMDAEGNVHNVDYLSYKVGGAESPDLPKKSNPYVCKKQ